MESNMVGLVEGHSHTQCRLPALEDPFDYFGLAESKPKRILREVAFVQVFGRDRCLGGATFSFNHPCHSIDATPKNLLLPFDQDYVVCGQDVVSAFRSNATCLFCSGIVFMYQEVRRFSYFCPNESLLDLTMKPTR
jgi:hypothetical protein